MDPENIVSNTKSTKWLVNNCVIAADNATSMRIDPRESARSE
jgi:hypothetical protein